ncbi:MAG: methyltransferase domain-containing protein [Sphingobacteriales bacterium]|jgi:2-polyprenyl-3-methyl-5-hydroxy-6-metoxy-1,4-benzoquinol methylase|nr:methyltransferase domain-containing protein [Sphingobacteriales bacterium]
MVNAVYIGTELDLFSKAKNWKQYYASQLGSYILGDVLEAGAGIGETSAFLMEAGNPRNWTCLEPDSALSKSIADKAGRGMFPIQPALITGTIADIASEKTFDTIVYIDVIEHIENDQSELERAKMHLKPGGHLIILVPAHNFLFSPFDKAIGHFRRYNRKRLIQAIPAGMTKVDLRYLDSVGMALSLANRFVLRSKNPNARQIHFWDRFIVPLSRIIDPVTGFGLGKTLIGIWRA